MIVNNDDQQLLKKGKIILDSKNRTRLIDVLHMVDETVLAIDKDTTVIETLRHIAERYPKDELIFANGGDRDSDKVTPEAAVCHELV